jgi:hypothetical protein
MESSKWTDGINSPGAPHTSGHAHISDKKAMYALCNMLGCMASLDFIQRLIQQTIVHISKQCLKHLM